MYIRTYTYVCMYVLMNIHGVYVGTYVQYHIFNN